MSNYDFSTLNSIDFEKLVCDVLNVKIDARYDTMFRSFKEGKDKGIDLLLSTKDNDFEVVVQIKHYQKSSFATLKRDLIKNEVKKVIKLKPRAYVFVTSLSLNIHNKEEIKNIFSPFIASVGDILGKDDINDIIRLNKSIEEKHFKLWFSSTIAIEKILQYKFVGRKNEFQENELKKKLRLFVTTRELSQTIELLDRNKFLIITGDPGVGKTTLSEILIYRFLSKEFDLTVIYDDIREIETTLRDDNSKQVFYFDDFLGHTQAEILKSKSAEAFLIKIISRIEKAENKYLILNTRKFILNSFTEESERFRYFNPLRSESRIELHSYSYGAKRRMLDNHIEESDLEDFQLCILRDLSFFICTHRNFSPRHLEFFTSSFHVGNLNEKDFKNFVVENLEVPKKIWEHAYINQISDTERFLINTLYSLKTNSPKEVLELAYNSRLNHEVNKNNFYKPINPFYDSLKRLIDGFIVTYNSKEITYFSFINPSLEDFLKDFLNNNSYELDKILYSAISLDQWFVFFEPFSGKKINSNLINYFGKIFLTNIKSDEELYKASIFMASQEYDDLLLISNILRDIKDWKFIKNNILVNNYSLKFLREAIKKRTLIYVISKLNLDYFFNLVLSCESLEELYEKINLFRNHYDLNFKDKFSTNSFFYGRYKSLVKEVKLLCQNLFIQEIDLQYDYLKKNIAKDEHLDVLNKLNDYLDFVKNDMFDSFEIDFQMFLNQDWNEIAELNYTNYLLKTEEIEYQWNDDYYNEQFYYEDEYDMEMEKSKSTQLAYKVNFDFDEHNDLPF